MTRYFFPSVRLSRTFSDLATDMETMMQSAFPEEGCSDNACSTEKSESTMRIPVDVLESDDAFTVVGDLPGADSETIEVTVEENQLKISAFRNGWANPDEKTTPATSVENSDEPESSDAKKTELRPTIRRQERASGQFLRTLSLPKNVDQEAIRADYQDGVISVSLPKQPEPQPRQIEVRVKS